MMIYFARARVNVMFVCARGGDLNSISKLTGLVRCVPVFQREPDRSSTYIAIPDACYVAPGIHAIAGQLGSGILCRIPGHSGKAMATVFSAARLSTNKKLDCRGADG